MADLNLLAPRINCMTSFSDTLSADHRRCDELFAKTEELVSKEDWNEGQPRFEAFEAAMERHFNMEESVLFPRFEKHTGQTAGPTRVMRMEHEQMRQLFREMGESLQQRRSDRFLGLSETLLMIMQQHNAKEEQILYRMADQALADRIDELLKEMSSL